MLVASLINVKHVYFYIEKKMDLFLFAFCKFGVVWVLERTHRFENALDNDEGQFAQ